LDRLSGAKPIDSPLMSAPSVDFAPLSPSFGIAAESLFEMPRVGTRLPFLAGQISPSAPMKESSLPMRTGWLSSSQFF
jgi:hypothetical protein